jgi:putative tryptophan/tyrosine transport system substrate-binding protein
MKHARAAALFLSFMALLAGPAAAQVAEPTMHRLGVLGATERSDELTRNATLPALAKLGFVEGRNLVVRISTGQPDQMPRLTAELLAWKPQVIIAIGGDVVTAAAKATGTVPIVAFGPDPVALGLAQNTARPGGNVTGVVILASELDAKRLHLLREMLPRARRMASLLRPAWPTREASERAMKEVADATGLELRSFSAGGAVPYAAAFAAMHEAGMEAVAISADPYYYRDTDELMALARQHRLPAVCQWAEMAKAGCLLSYGPSLPTTRRRVAGYVAAILRGASAAELPIEQPTNFELVLNLGVAAELGIDIPPAMLARADEVIE